MRDVLSKVTHRGFFNSGTQFFTALFLVIFCHAAVASENYADTLLARKPLKIKGEWPASPLRVSDYVIRFEDTVGVTHRINRLLGEDGVPLGYVSHIETPVCSDTLCNLMDIRMFWTLAGSYWAYDTITRKPLTKNDHLKFDAKDYEKLHELLQDEQSILRRRHKDDLFDKEAKRVSKVVDAVTGATAKEVKEAAVDGAVYSSFTIYHLVHSQLAAVIRDDVRKHLLKDLAPKLSRSDKVDERIFFFKELDDSQVARYVPDMVATILPAIPRDRLFIMKKIPDSSWSQPEVQVPVAQMADRLDIHSLSHFLNQLKETEQLSLECLRPLSRLSAGLTLNQLKTYMILLDREDRFAGDPAIRKELEATASRPDYRYRDILSTFLNKKKLTP
ncbi:hypothetical protein GCM10023091_34410 [Ravibacter arvi]|uniref:Uncharacterized protein n=1 Tax=Ravibacter arvi TaxID=2051041 RepID=A0ABP8M6M3_9BACT